MVAVDFFAALNSYDFFNQYCSNLLKNPTVRGLTDEVGRKRACLRMRNCYVRKVSSYGSFRGGAPNLRRLDEGV